MNRKRSKILFIGFTVSEAVMDAICKIDQRPQIAAHKLQWNIISGLENAIGKPIDLISSIPVNNYPLFPQIFICGSKWKHRPNANNVTIPFINIVLFKHITRFISCLVSVSNWSIRNRRYEIKQIIIYALHSPHVLAAMAATIVFGGDIVIIIPDLPAYMDRGLKRNLIRRILKPFDSFLLTRLMNKAKGLIVLTKQMAEDFAPDVPSLVIEGAVSSQEISSTSNNNFTDDKSNDGEKKIIMYAGNLLEAYGVKLLLDAIKLIKEESYILWIFGKGEMEKDIESISNTDERVIYGGFIAHDEFIRKASQATVLVNPRYSDMNYTRYSFPSKVLEYMKTGCPTITTALPGIPVEYHDYVFLLQDECPEALANLIVEICSKDQRELQLLGETARKFVMKEKNSIRQGMRINNFLKELR